MIYDIVFSYIGAAINRYAKMRRNHLIDFDNVIFCHYDIMEMIISSKMQILDEINVRT